MSPSASVAAAPVSSLEQLAEQVARSGLRRAVVRLGRSFASGLFSGAHPAGTYDVLVLVSGTEASVTAFGTVLDDRGEPVVCRLQERVLLEEQPVLRF